MNAQNLCIVLVLVLSCMVCTSWQVSSSEKGQLLKQHNDLRRKIAKGQTSGQPAAADMLEMVWSDALANIAERHARKCVFRHDSYDDRRTKGFQFVGQNIYGGWETKDAIQMWFDEFKDYTYNGKRCRGVCGHYTQIAWAKSNTVGCAIANCESNKSFGMKFFVVCNYGPAGNFNNEAPYVSGAACSKCPSGTKCADGLCK